MSTRDGRTVHLEVHVWCRDATSGEERLSLRKPESPSGGPDFHGLAAAGFRGGEQVVLIPRERYELLLALEQLL